MSTWYSVIPFVRVFSFALPFIVNLAWVFQFVCCVYGTVPQNNTLSLLVPKPNSSTRFRYLPLQQSIYMMFDSLQVTANAISSYVQSSGLCGDVTSLRSLVWEITNNLCWTVESVLCACVSPVSWVCLPVCPSVEFVFLCGNCSSVHAPVQLLLT